ncbi:MAG: hypothetical protein JNG89_06985, partial [Planctomycetaceae bacterium]|nr:hypothetical protein [Planctomycetaceae bacterium]
MRAILLAIVVSAMGFLSSHCRADDSVSSGQQQPAELDRTLRVEMDYLLYLPQDYDAQDQWPL